MRDFSCSFTSTPAINLVGSWSTRWNPQTTHPLPSSSLQIKLVEESKVEEEDGRGWLFRRDTRPTSAAGEGLCGRDRGVSVSRPSDGSVSCRSTKYVYRLDVSHVKTRIDSGRLRRRRVLGRGICRRTLRWRKSDVCPNRLDFPPFRPRTSRVRIPSPTDTGRRQGRTPLRRRKV